MIRPDTDPRGADSRRAQSDCLAGPLQAGFDVAELPLDAAGGVSLSVGASQLSVLARLNVDLGDEAVELSVDIAGGGANATVRLVFESYTPAGAALWVRRRGAVPDGGVRLTFTATRAGAAVAAAALPALIAVDGLAGNMAHVTSVLSFEQQRIRRHLCAIAAARSLPGARGAMLDHLGADLGVPRLDNRPVFTAGRLSDMVREREADSAYRSRLKLYRGRAFPTPEEVLARLNEIHAGFTLEERDNPYEVGLRLVAVADTSANAQALRSQALERLRLTQLIDPVAPPRDRQIPHEAQQRERELRQRLANGFSAMPANAAPLAPSLAAGLDRLLAFAKAVQFTGPIALRKAQDDDGGAPFELGLGAQLRTAATFAKQLSDKVAAADPTTTGVFQPLVERLQKDIATAQAQNRTLTTRDLLEPLGFATVRPVSSTEFYVSPLPIGGLDIDGPGALALVGGAALTEFVARDLAPITSAALADALSRAAQEAGVAGAAVTGADIQGFLPTLPAHAATYLDQALPSRLSIADQPALARALGDALAAPGATTDHLSGLVIAGAMAADLRAGQEDDWDKISAVSFALADIGAPTMAVLVRETGDVVLVASSRPLPLLGANLTLRKGLATRWVCGELDPERDAEPPTQALSRTGERFEVNFLREGLFCLGLVAYRRTGRTDPMEVRPELPPGASLDYEAYERMMNVLTLVCPAAVEINTWRIRQRHVRLDPQAPAAALNLSVARSFRRYRQPRFAVAQNAPAGSGDPHG